MDAANIGLKAFTDDCYQKVTFGRLGPVLDTLRYLRHETDVWLEITTSLIPGLNDSPAEIDRLTGWVAGELGPDVPVDFSAVHPDAQMQHIPPTPPATLAAARRIGLANGLRYVYIGNVRDRDGGTTYCPGCARALVERDDHQINAYRLDDLGRCRSCAAQLPGLYLVTAGTCGPRRVPIRLGRAD